MIKSSSKKKKEETCDDWEDEEYDYENNNPSDKLASGLSPSENSTKTLEPSSQASTDYSKSINFQRKNIGVDDDYDGKSNDKRPDSQEVQNYEIWNNANQKPQYVIVPSTSKSAHSATNSTRPIPQNAIFGLSNLTILKRPSKTQSIDGSKFSSHNSKSTSTTCDLNSREKSYQEARDRIFGNSNGSMRSSNNSNSDGIDTVNNANGSTKIETCLSDQGRQSSGLRNLKAQQNSQHVQIERQPIGPDKINQKGFFNQRSKNT
ncbi:expressed protein [Phakopsora pachyrhizi]|uniref:Expressed protein n=1 Tax=Phakopsora pachyrhizi TaxID=170000 RepID=A0AAV0B1R7_PHAPC|nr:expressed protein [Phakopsora pachyrhizi]